MDAEIEDVKPKIIDFLETSGAEVLEKEIQAAIPARAMIVSRGLRALFDTNEIDRAGKGRRGDPFRYSRSSILSRREERVLTPGIETENYQKTFDPQSEILFPKNREENRNRKEEKKVGGKPVELESNGWEEI